MTDTHSKRGIVLSDAHFLGNYWPHCDSRLRQNDLSALCDGADIAVLNGDTFDCHASRMSPQAWLQEASGIMTRWLDDHPQCEFHYIFGNHDNYAPWLERLREIAGKFSGQLHLHEDEWRVGNALFIHGDFAHNGEMQIHGKRIMKSREIMEKRAQQTKNGSDSPHASHEAHMQQLIDALNRAHRLDGVGHLFAGHFHRPAVNHMCEAPAGLRYHNTGSPITGNSFVPLRFDMDGQKTVSNVRCALPLAIVPCAPSAGVVL